MIDPIAEARRRKAAGEFLTHRQRQLLWEAETPAAAKEPWQMTRAEYWAYSQQFYRLRGRMPDKVHYEVIEKALSEGRPVPTEALRDYPDLAQAAAKEPWQMTQVEFFETPEGKPTVQFPINVKHRAAVEQALREGKPVPPEVLKDYPDLAPPGNPQYGPIGKPTPKQKAFWEESQREAEAKYPLGNPVLQAEARRAGVSPTEMQKIVAHQIYLEKMRRLGERYAKEEWATPAGHRELERERREEERERREEEEG